MLVTNNLYNKDFFNFKNYISQKL